MSKRTIAVQLREHMPDLRRYALVLTRNHDEAEDLVQDCLGKAIAAADTWRPDTNLKSWLFRILYTTHISALRKARVRSEAQADLPDPVVEANQTSRVELQQVLRALDALPEPQRRAIELVALQEMSYAEAAQTLGIPAGTFMSRLARGREALRTRLEGLRSPNLRLVRRAA